MKTQHLPPEVVESLRGQLAAENEALTLAANVMQAFEAVETVYESAGKADWPPEMKLRFRRMAERARDTLEGAKATFSAATWVAAWENAGRNRMRAFAAAGAQLPTFIPTEAEAVEIVPESKAVAVLDEAIAHLGELVWHSELYDLFAESKESQR